VQRVTQLNASFDEITVRSRAVGVGASA